MPSDDLDSTSIRDIIIAYDKVMSAAIDAVDDLTSRCYHNPELARYSVFREEMLGLIWDWHTDDGEIKRCKN